MKPNAPLHLFVRTLTAIVFLAISGCAKVSVDPSTSFASVQQSIQQNTGYTPYRVQGDDCLAQGWVDESLACPLTIDSAVAIALIQNPALQALYSDLGIAQAQLAQASLLPNPILDFSYRFATVKGIDDLIDISFLPSFLAILLRPLKMKMAAAELCKVEAQVTEKLIAAIGEVQLAFIELQVSQHSQQLYQQLALCDEASYELAESLFKAGNIAEPLLIQLHLQYQESLLSLASQKLQIVQAREKINRLLGLRCHQLCWRFVASLPAITSWCIDTKTALDSALQSNLQLIAMRHEIEATALSLGIDKTKIIWPEIDIGPSAEREGGVWYVGPAINIGIPIFDWGIPQNALAYYTLQRLCQHYQSFAIEVASTARLATQQLATAHSLWRQYSGKILPLAKSQVEQTLLQYNAMQSSAIALLDAKRSQLLKEISALEAFSDYWKARINVSMLLQGHKE